jgi:carbon-monoxide dehydrogenase medium subunit
LTFGGHRRLISTKHNQNPAGEVTLMKASAFSYARATSVENALELPVAHGDGAKVLSGGQSLMPAMNLRLISPELLGGIAELRGIEVRGDILRIGALTPHVDLARSPEIAAHAPLLTEAIAHVAHPAIRNKGTIGGSLAHADPCFRTASLHGGAGCAGANLNED